MSLGLPHTFLDLPEEGPQVSADPILSRLRAVGLQVEENFRALDASPQFTPAATTRYLTAQSTNSASGALGANIIYTNATITLPPGAWVVRAFASAFTSDVVDDVAVGVYNQTTSAEVTNGRGAAATTQTTPAINFRASLSTEILMTVEADTQICPLICRNGSSTLGASSAAGGIVGRITATRR